LPKKKKSKERAPLSSASLLRISDAYHYRNLGATHTWKWVRGV
jgi:hypothetical protein